MKHEQELRFASERFATIEVNGSFYSLQTPKSYQRWQRETPENFVFSVKGGRFITPASKHVPRRALTAHGSLIPRGTAQSRSPFSAGW